MYEVLCRHSNGGRTSESAVNLYQTTQCRNPEEIYFTNLCLLTARRNARAKLNKNKLVKRALMKIVINQRRASGTCHARLVENWERNHH